MAKKEYSLEPKQGYAYLDKGDILHITDHPWNLDRRLAGSLDRNLPGLGWFHDGKCESAVVCPSC